MDIHNPARAAFDGDADAAHQDVGNAPGEMALAGQCGIGGYSHFAYSVA